jgi:AraC-like DNA-binding protein
MKEPLLIDWITEYVYTRPTEDLGHLTVSILADRFRRNRAYLSRRFHREKEVTLQKFLIQEKLRRGTLLLRNDRNLTVKAVTEILGFSSSEYFIRIFKRQFGLTPSRFRRCRLRDEPMAD